MTEKVYNLVEDIIDFVIENHGYVAESMEYRYEVDIDTALSIIKTGLSCLEKVEEDD